MWQKDSFNTKTPLSILWSLACIKIPLNYDISRSVGLKWETAVPDKV